MTPPPKQPAQDLLEGSAPPAPAVRPLAVTRGGRWRRALGVMGPGYLIAVGYVDPGNWATDLAAGSHFGYALLWVVMLSNLMAIVLQILAIRLGIVTGMDLAQACRAHASRGSCYIQWLACEIAICACDVAEVIGTAIALKLLFGLPLAWGVALTALDAAVVFWLQGRGLRYLEAAIAGVLTLIFGCFCVMLFLARPDWPAVGLGLLPDAAAIGRPDMLYLAIGIIGATVMPHNLYLHSALVQRRPYAPTDAGKQKAIALATADIVVALCFAFFINAAILILSAAAFHARGYRGVADIEQAHHLLSPLLGTSLAGTLFALALLASGQSSTVTATLAGQIVMEGFLRLRIPAWTRRLLTRSVAITPALCATLWYGDAGIGRLLLFSQVVLSLQLPFAIVPLLRYTSDRKQMGCHVNRRWLSALAASAAMLIVVLNAAIVYNLLTAD